ncbi:hypothetical protein BO83DRAFT_397473 [Aspergillus eucalypticola CBS 122712]|uniref:Uncharacterized protein n=1 Tax=Aspergillus eucalypticola (strain CBS 122712 / IBT 29274) TaxID=1448314 RepID=A0A317VUA7_ASPEC|nr:uncharacterized protein BO83DRAFT_397473 [Aspergillus eucalypticola CBS 122712]PWY76607.1 hypothetical protein BO83DRAFT_397473 [Aspergillus eucalypticola CBS 122712]
MPDSVSAPKAGGHGCSPKLFPETKQLTRDTCCRYPSRHQPAPTQKIDSISSYTVPQRPMIAGQTVGNASPMASSRVTEPTLHDMICAEPVAAQKRSTCTPFRTYNATAFSPANQIEVAERREIKSTRDVQMMVIGNKRDLIKNQRPRTRRTTNAAGKEVILERSTEFGEDFAQPVKGPTSPTIVSKEFSHCSAVIIILTTTTPVTEKGKYHYRRNFESEVRNRFLGRDGQVSMKKYSQYFDDQLAVSAFIRNGPSSALALPVRPRDRGWSCEQPEPARQFCSFSTLVNDRLNLRWVQEPSKTSRRTIWMFFPPTSWGIRSPPRGKKDEDDVLLKRRSVRHCIVPCRKLWDGEWARVMRPTQGETAFTRLIMVNAKAFFCLLLIRPPSKTTRLMRDDRLAPSVSLIVSRCWIPCQWSHFLHTAHMAAIHIHF